MIQRVTLGFGQQLSAAVYVFPPCGGIQLVGIMRRVLTETKQLYGMQIAENMCTRRTTVY